MCENLGTEVWTHMELPQAVICPWLGPSHLVHLAALFLPPHISHLSVRCLTQILKLLFFPTLHSSCLAPLCTHSCSPTSASCSGHERERHLSSTKSTAQEGTLVPPGPGLPWLTPFLWLLPVEKGQSRPGHGNSASKSVFLPSRPYGALKLFLMVTSKSLSRLEGLMTFYLRSVLPASLFRFTGFRLIISHLSALHCLSLWLPESPAITQASSISGPRWDGCEYTMLLIAYQSHTQGEGGITPNPKAGWGEWKGDHCCRDSISLLRSSRKSG